MIDDGSFRSDGIRRSGMYGRLDALVREHRFTIAVVVPVIGAGILAASAAGWLPGMLAFNPILVVLGVLVMRLPLVVGILPLLGRRAIIGLGLLSIYTYLVEYIGVQTGMPYGEFSYGVSLGPMVSGIPVALPVFFIPLALNAYLLWMLVLPRPGHPTLRVALVVPTVVLLDVVLDPAAVALGFWSFDGGGRFYGVPLTNYAGWFLSATVAVLAIEFGFDTEAVDRRTVNCQYILDDLLSFVILWGAINLLFGLWIPAAVAIGLGLFLGVGKLPHRGEPTWKFPRPG